MQFYIIIMAKIYMSELAPPFFEVPISMWSSLRVIAPLLVNIFEIRKVRFIANSITFQMVYNTSTL